MSNLYTGLLRCQCGATVHLLAKRPGVKYLTCSARIAGSKCKVQAWPYHKTEPMLLALLQRVIPWAKLLPTTKTDAQKRVAALVEQGATLEVERVSLDAKVAKVVEAIEQVGISAALTARLTALEAQAASLRLTAEDVRGRVLEARAILANARETVQRQREAFEAYKAGKLSDEESRTRLSSALRELLKRIELRQDRRLGVVLASGEDEDFVCEADLSAVYDLQGEEVVRVVA